LERKEFGIINSITKLHLVGISTESSTIHRSMNIKHAESQLYERNVYVMIEFQDCSTA
jgi:hypothetical protein